MKRNLAETLLPGGFPGFEGGLFVGDRKSNGKGSGLTTFGADFDLTAVKSAERSERSEGVRKVYNDSTLKGIVSRLQEILRPEQSSVLHFQHLYRHRMHNRSPNAY